MLDEIGYNISIYEPFVCILEKKQKQLEFSRVDIRPKLSEINI